MINSASNELKTRSEMTKLGIYQQYLINATRQQISLYRCQQPTSRPTNQPQTRMVVISFILTPYLFLFSPFFFSFLLGLTFFCLSFLSPPLSLCFFFFFLSGKEADKRGKSICKVCCAVLRSAVLCSAVLCKRCACFASCFFMDLSDAEHASFRAGYLSISETSNREHESGLIKEAERQKRHSLAVRQSKAVKKR